MLFKRTGGSTWLGISDDDEDNIFTKFDGSALTYENWRPGEPNHTSQQCAVANYNGNPKWIDIMCSGCVGCIKCYVCEKEVLVPVDECLINADDCDDNATCTDLPDGFECTCNEGYVGSGTECEVHVPVDECSEGTDDCDENATCSDLEYGFECTCNEGYSGDGTECVEGIHLEYF